MNDSDEKTGNALTREVHLTPRATLALTAAIFLVLGVLIWKDGRPGSHSYSGGLEDSALLRVRREGATKHVLKTRVLRDPDSASFSFENRGPNTLRVRVRHQNLFGAYLVQNFDVAFPPGSVVANGVREVR